MSLKERLKAEIAAGGPIPVAEYMVRCLHDAKDGYYATRSALGAAGSLIALLFWVYYTAQIFLFGACVTRAYAHALRHEDEKLEAGERAHTTPPRPQPATAWRRQS